MNSEEVKVGKAYVIDTAPLIASPRTTGRTFVGVVHHVNDNQAYVIPQGFGSALYINFSWFIKESK